MRRERLRQRERELKDSESKREVEREGEKEIEGAERERLSLKKFFLLFNLFITFGCIGSDFSVDHLVMSMCTVFSCVVRGCLLQPVLSLCKTLLAFALLHSVLQGQVCLLLHVSLDPLVCLIHNQC